MGYIFTHDSSQESMWDSHPIMDARNNLTVCDLYHHTYPECLEHKERWLKISGIRGSMDSFPCMAHVYRKVYVSPVQCMFPPLKFTVSAKFSVSVPYVCSSAFFPHPSPQPTHSSPPSSAAATICS